MKLQIKVSMKETPFIEGRKGFAHGYEFRALLFRLRAAVFTISSHSSTYVYRHCMFKPNWPSPFVRIGFIPCRLVKRPLHLYSTAMNVFGVCGFWRPNVFSFRCEAVMDVFLLFIPIHYSQYSAILSIGFELLITVATFCEATACRQAVYWKEWNSEISDKPRRTKRLSTLHCRTHQGQIFLVSLAAACALRKVPLLPWQS